MKRKIITAAVSTTLLLFGQYVSATPLDRITINGYLEVEYEKFLSGDENGDEVGSFDSDLFDLVFNFQVTDDFRVAADLTWEHGSATEAGKGNVAVEYAFVEYAKSDIAKFRAGKMFTNFGIYNEIHTAKPATLTVKEPKSTNKTNKLGKSFRFFPRWNTGIALTGDGIMGDMDFDYIVQYVNGGDDEVAVFEDAPIPENAANQFAGDQNSNKGINFRYRINPFDDLRVGFSYYMDTININDEDAAAAGDLTVIDEADISSFGLQVEWESPLNIGVEFEYVTGNAKTSIDQGKSNDSTPFNEDSAGMTLMLSYPMDNGLTPYFRYEHLEPDGGVDNDEGSIFIYGINYQIDTNFFLKLEINDTKTDEYNSKFDGEDYRELKAGISIGF